MQKFNYTQNVGEMSIWIYQYSAVSYSRDAKKKTIIAGLWPQDSAPKGVTDGEQEGRNFPGANYGGAEKSQQCHKYFLENSTFASERPQVRTRGRQTCCLPGIHLTQLPPSFCINLKYCIPARLHGQGYLHKTMKCTCVLWSVFHLRCTNAQYHQTVCAMKSHSRVLPSSNIPNLIS